MDAEVRSSHQIAANAQVCQTRIVGHEWKTTQHDIVNRIIGDQVMNRTFVLDTHCLLD